MFALIINNIAALSNAFNEARLSEIPRWVIIIALVVIGCTIIAMPGSLLWAETGCVYIDGLYPVSLN